jgi:hypothetical protein
MVAAPLRKAHRDTSFSFFQRTTLGVFDTPRLIGSRRGECIVNRSRWRDGYVHGWPRFDRIKSGLRQLFFLRWTYRDKS